MDFATALRTLWPNGDERIPGLIEGMIASAPAVFAKHGFDSPQVVAHFMAQVSHECGAGHDVVENLNYSPQRMVVVWPKRFPTITKALPFAHNPQALANEVYNGRMGNREGSSDGWDFRGRGAVQTTGRDNYAAASKEVGLDLLAHPELVNDPKYFLECGAADFVLCGCLPFAQKGDFTTETKQLNGGTVGIVERRVWLKKWTDAKVEVPQLLVAAASVPWWKRIL